MAARKRDARQREHDLVRTAALFLEGHPCRAIARLLSAERAYSLSHTVIHRDIQLLLQRWRESQLRDTDAALTAELSRLAKTETAAWDAWRKSLDDAETVVDEDGPKGRTTRRTIAGQSGNASHLAIIERCIGRRCRLLGLEDYTIRLRLSELETLIGGVE